MFPKNKCRKKNQIFHTHSPQNMKKKTVSNVNKCFGSHQNINRKLFHAVMVGEGSIVTITENRFRSLFFPGAQRFHNTCLFSL